MFPAAQFLWAKQTHQVFRHFQSVLGPVRCLQLHQILCTFQTTKHHRPIAPPFPKKWSQCLLLPSFTFIHIPLTWHQINKSSALILSFNFSELFHLLSILPVFLSPFCSFSAVEDAIKVRSYFTSLESAISWHTDSTIFSSVIQSVFNLGFTHIIYLRVFISSEHIASTALLFSHGRWKCVYTEQA